MRGARAPDLAMLVLLASAECWIGAQYHGCLVRTVCGETHNATCCAALNLGIQAQHLADERFQAAKLDNEEFVVGCGCHSQDLPPQHHNGIRTVDGEVRQSSASSALDFSVVTAEEEEDGIEGFAVNRLNLFLGNFSERDSGPSLEVDIVGKRECCQRCQWSAQEEVGIRAV